MNIFKNLKRCKCIICDMPFTTKRTEYCHISEMLLKKIIYCEKCLDTEIDIAFFFNKLSENELKKIMLSKERFWRMLAYDEWKRRRKK